MQPGEYAEMVNSQSDLLVTHGNYSWSDVQRMPSHVRNRCCQKVIDRLKAEKEAAESARRRRR